MLKVTYSINGDEINLLTVNIVTKIFTHECKDFFNVVFSSGNHFTISDCVLEIERAKLILAVNRIWAKQQKENAKTVLKMEARYGARRIKAK